MRFRARNRPRELPPWRKDPIGETQRLRDTLANGTIEERVQAIKRVQLMLHNQVIDGEKAKGILVRALTDYQLPVRFKAIQAMIADRGTIAGALIAIKSGGTEIKRMTLRLLNDELEYDQGLWKTDNLTDEEVHEACTVLARALTDRDDTVGHEACKALCQMAERSPVHVMERLSDFKGSLDDEQAKDATLRRRVERVEDAMTNAMERGRVKG